MNEQETIQEKAILVGCQLPHITDEHFENSMEELVHQISAKTPTSVTRANTAKNAA
ncbi:GTPase HflX, partial [Bacillus subtilis]